MALLTSRKVALVAIAAGALVLATVGEAWAQRGRSGGGGGSGSGGYRGGSHGGSHQGGYHGGGGYRGGHYGGYRGGYHGGYRGGYYGGYRGGYGRYYGYGCCSTGQYVALGLGAAAFGGALAYAATQPSYGYAPSYYYPPPYYPPYYAPAYYAPSPPPQGPVASPAYQSPVTPLASPPSPRTAPDDAKMLSMRVQLELMRRSYYGGPIDGKVGPATRKGLTDFQRDNRLSTSGAIDGPTLSALGLTGRG